MKKTYWLFLAISIVLAACAPTAPTPEFQPEHTLPPYPPPRPTPFPTLAGGYPFPQSPTPVFGGGYPGPGGVVTWEEARDLILSGQVSQVVQLHNLTVTLTLRDGRVVTTTEPAIDDVFAVIEECGDPCSDILIATE